MNEGGSACTSGQLGRKTRPQTQGGILPSARHIPATAGPRSHPRPRQTRTEHVCASPPSVRPPVNPPKQDGEKRCAKRGETLGPPTVTKGPSEATLPGGRAFQAGAAGAKKVSVAGVQDEVTEVGGVLGGVGGEAGASSGLHHQALGVFYKLESIII